MANNNNNYDAAAKYASIQQAYKKEPGEDKRKPVSFTTPIQAVFDAKTGASLEAILAQFNSIYVQYQGSPQATRNIIPVEMRRPGLTITYMNMESETITERANSAVQKDNDHWGLDVNWSRIDELSLSGDISVSANGTWIINGEDTGVKAVGPKGDTGLTPWLKTIDNKLHFSYDNVTWEPCSENIAAWFRWSGNKIQISRDNKTWTDLSGKFADNIHIKGYVASTAALPAGAAQGDIYGVGPTYAAEDTAHTNPIYRYYVRNANAWVDNGSFTSLSAGVVQEPGFSETEVMSQKAITELESSKIAVYNLDELKTEESITFGSKADARVYAVMTLNLKLVPGNVLKYTLHDGIKVSEMLTKIPASSSEGWIDTQLYFNNNNSVVNLNKDFKERLDARRYAYLNLGIDIKIGTIIIYTINNNLVIDQCTSYNDGLVDSLDEYWTDLLGVRDNQILSPYTMMNYYKFGSFGSGLSIDLWNNGVIKLTFKAKSAGGLDFAIKGYSEYAVKIIAKSDKEGQILRIGEAASVGGISKLLELTTEYKEYDVYLSGYNIDTPLTTFVIAEDYNENNNIYIKNLSISKGGELGTRVAKLENLFDVNSPITFFTDSFLQSCSRINKYLTKIACAGDSLIANAIGGDIPSKYDEGSSKRPIRMLTNGIPRRLYDYLSWNKPTWRRLDDSDWNVNGFTIYNESGVFEGTGENYWKAEQVGSYIEITVPNGMEHFALVCRTKNGYGKLNVTLNGGSIGEYENKYYSSKVQSNAVVNSNVVPQYIERGVNQIDLNVGVSSVGNPYHVVEFNNLPSGDNVIRFTTDSSERCDVWGGFYWSGNTMIVMNIAHGGHTTSDLLNQHLEDELFGANYDAVLFEITEMNNLRLPLGQTELDLINIIKRLQSMNIDFCFTSCNPLGLSITHDINFYTEYTNPTQHQVNELVRKVCYTQKVPFIDIFKYFEQHIRNRGGSLETGEGGLWYTWDGQHGNEEGVKIWFDCLKYHLNNKLIMIE